MPQNDLNKILLSAVEDSLSSLGNSSKHAILYHLETHFNIRKEHIPTSLTEFTKALEEIFGPGAEYLEKLIVQRFCERSGVNMETESWADFLNIAKDRLMHEEECVV